VNTNRGEGRKGNSQLGSYHSQGIEQNDTLKEANRSQASSLFSAVLSSFREYKALAV
jgi:hypothetical protein